MTCCVILGAGGHARETFWHAKQAQGTRYDDFIFVDDTGRTESVELDGKRWPVQQHWDFEKQLGGGGSIGFLIGVGSPATKIAFVEKALKAGLRPLPSVVHQSAIIQDPACKIGLGGMIGPGCVLTTGITIGDFVIVNCRTTIGHGSELQDYVTCAPGVSIAGDVMLRKGVSLGIGSVVRERISIAPFVVAGAQACIVKSIEAEGTTVVGVPARAIQGA